MPGVDFTCTSAQPLNVEESRLSFPSGHAMLSFYGLTFLSLFIGKFWRHELLGGWIHFFQAILISSALYISLTRVTDNKHHPTDVLVGAVLGIVLASIAFYYLLVALRRGDEDEDKNNKYYSELDGAHGSSLRGESKELNVIVATQNDKKN